MSRHKVDIQSSGAYGIRNNDVNTTNDSRLTLWVNDETGRMSFNSGGSYTVGKEVMSVACGSANDAEGGLRLNDVGNEQMISRRESTRAPRGFDDPNMDEERFDLATQERIEGEAEQDKRSTQLAERFEAIMAEALEEGVRIKSRAERCREDVSNRERYSKTLGHGWFDAHTVPVPKSAKDEDRVSQDELIETVEIERDDRNPFLVLDSEQVGEANMGGQQLDEYFGNEPTMSRSSMAKCVARRMMKGQDAASAVLAVKDAIESMPRVKQPIAKIDPFAQNETTIVGTIETLWFPKGDRQYQVGLIKDESGEPIKITVWHRAGNKPVLREGDKVRVVRGKVNAYKKGGQWNTSIAIDSDAEIHHIEKGDGPATRNKVRSESKDLPAWDSDSDSHQWLKNQSEDEHKEVSEDGTKVTHKRRKRSLPEEGHHTMEDFKDSLDIGPESKECCPECGSTNTSSHQQQVGGADEGMTGFHVCTDCDHSWRSGY